MIDAQQVLSTSSGNSGKPKLVIVPKEKVGNGDSEVNKESQEEKTIASHQNLLWKKEQSKNIVGRQQSARNSKILSSSVRMIPMHPNVSVNEDILQDMKHKFENYNKQLSLENYAIYPVCLPKLLPAKKRQKVTNLPQLQSETDLVGNSISKSSHTVVPKQQKLLKSSPTVSNLNILEELLRNPAAISSKHSKMPTTPEISKGEGDQNRNKIAIQEPHSSKMARSKFLSKSIQTKVQQAMPNKFATDPCTSEIVQNKNITANQPPSTFGISLAVGNIIQNVTSHVRVLPKTDQSVKSVGETSKISGYKKSVPRNLPNLFEIPDLPLSKNDQEYLCEIEDTGYVEELPASYENNFRGWPHKKLIKLYFHIMGRNKRRKTVNEMISLAFTAMKRSISQKRLVDLIEKGEFINFNRMVLWGINQKRSLKNLFSTVKPAYYSLDDAKIYLLKYAKGLFFKKKKENKTKAKGIECQACRKRLHNILQFLEHLNREPAEITYMCRHCGYLRFTNICALVYHILSDKDMKPSREYCVLCGLYCDSLECHLINREKSLNNINVQCNLNKCDFVAYSNCSLKLHLFEHKEELPYICPECGEYFIFKKHLEEHKKNVCFINYKFKYYFCSSESCGMILSNLNNFFTHIFREHFERRVICSLCRQMFTAQCDFTTHRNTAHGGLTCSFNVHNYCTLCPNFTYRGKSQQKHLESHSCENKCLIMVYKCDCDFQTLFKRKFIEHKTTKSCQQKSFDRPQVMKICQNCSDVHSFNFTTPNFFCEECLLILKPSLSLINYCCKICHLVVDYSWSSVLDHFFLFHERTDLLSLSLHTMLIISKNKVVPGSYLSQKEILDVNVEFMNNILRELSGNKNTNVSHAEPKKSNTSFAGELNQSVSQRKLRSQNTINALLSRINSNSSSTNMPQNASHQNNFFCRKCDFTTFVKSEIIHHAQNHLLNEPPCSICKTASGRCNHIMKDHSKFFLSKNAIKSVEHGSVQKILKEQIEGKLLCTQTGKTQVTNHEQAQNMPQKEKLVIEIED